MICKDVVMKDMSARELFVNQPRDKTHWRVAMWFPNPTPGTMQDDKDDMLRNIANCNGIIYGPLNLVCFRGFVAILIDDKTCTMGTNTPKEARDVVLDR